MKYDVVYVLKEDIIADELRYSLRSIEQNFPYNKVWFYTGCPKEIQPDYYVPHKQTERSKADRGTATLKLMCQNDDITDNFWLFNDDFFVMKEMQNPPIIAGGDLSQYIVYIKKWYGKESKYTRLLRRTIDILKKEGKGIISYDTHTPFLVNREKMLYLLKRYPNGILPKSLYGNYYNVPYLDLGNAKTEYFELDKVPSGEEPYLSTDDISWKKGIIGDYVRQAFPNPSKYEIIEEK